MTSAQKFVSATVAALMAASCTPVIVEDVPGPREDYFDGDFEYATHKGAIVTVVVGNPFGLPKEQFDATIRRALANSVTTGTADFVAEASDKTLAPFKVVVAFNTPTGIGNEMLCQQGANTPVQDQKGNMHVRISFCDGDRLKTGSAGWVSGASSIDDRRFKELVKQTAVVLIPIQDSEEQGEGDSNGSIP